MGLSVILTKFAVNDRKPMTVAACSPHILLRVKEDFRKRVCALVGTRQNQETANMLWLLG